MKTKMTKREYVKSIKFGKKIIADPADFLSDSDFANAKSILSSRYFGDSKEQSKARPNDVKVLFGVDIPDEDTRTCFVDLTLDCGNKITLISGYWTLMPVSDSPNFPDDFDFENFQSSDDYNAVVSGAPYNFGYLVIKPEKIK